MENTEVLDRPKGGTSTAIVGASITVIDNETGTVSYEYLKPELMLAESNSQLAQARELVPLIDSASMFEEAGALLQKIVGDKKSLDETRLAKTKPLRDKAAEINGDFAQAIEVRQQAENILKQGIANYTAKVEAERQRLQREAEARAAQARRAAEAEVAEIKRKAEADAAEQRRKADAEAAETQRIADAEATRIRDEAAAAAAAGNTAMAAELNQQAETVVTNAAESAQSTIAFAESTAEETRQTAAVGVESMLSASTMMTAPTVAIAKPKMSGISQSTKYIVEVTDNKEFIAYVLNNWDTMNHLVTIEQGKLNSMAQNQKDRFNLPGCKLRTETQVSSRRKT